LKKAAGRKRRTLFPVLCSLLRSSSYLSLLPSLCSSFTFLLLRALRSPSPAMQTILRTAALRAARPSRAFVTRPSVMPLYRTQLRTLVSTYRIPVTQCFFSTHSRTFFFSPAFSLQRTAKRYTTDHEAVIFDDATGVGIVSITDYAQSSLGDVVFVELPALGTEVGQGGMLCFLRGTPPRLSS
jgi:hypothetical protein